MIEIKLSNIVDNINVFSELSTREMPAIIAFRMAHIVDKITKEYNTFQDVREKMIHKYGEKDENGKLKVDENNQVHFSEENTTLFNNEMIELMNTVINIDEEKIPISTFKDMYFTPAQMYLLEPLIEG